jgi:hypothetical protein
MNFDTLSTGRLSTAVFPESNDLNFTSG